ncbi:MAG: hypothetical protein RBR59_09905, partial [Sulfurimonadaceae bacterium]|nr:hypothetical protein [Sulfurimonadaceae bacterium]
MQISNNISSMYAHQQMMNVSANNVANVNTERFVPTDVKMSSEQNGGVSANLRMATDSGSQRSQTDLAKEIPDQMVVSNVTSANVAAIKTQDE